jgi:hypothetical protein
MNRISQAATAQSFWELALSKRGKQNFYDYYLLVKRLKLMMKPINSKIEK